MFDTTKKIGILGGGQLGKMLGLAAANWDFKMHILDAKDCPASIIATEHVVGNFKNYDDVLQFGRNVDLLTIEIESVNLDALLQLEREGLTIHPSPNALGIIKDKGLQKQFYATNALPSADFQLFDSADELKKAIENGTLHFPFVQKTRTDGYDGKGVSVIRSAADVADKLLAGPCLAEDLVQVQTEIAVIAAKNADGQVSVFPAVEMEFHPEANLVEFLVCPARISPLVAAEAEALAEQVIRSFDVCGLLAVEMFLTTAGELLINEVAPRPHNSGHHTIDSAFTSQYQQHLLAICNLPLGDTTEKLPSVMVNLLGEPGYQGPVKYQGIEECLALGGVNVHLYGKSVTSPFRKMGHVTVVDTVLEKAIQKARLVKEKLKVISTVAPK